MTDCACRTCGAVAFRVRIERGLSPAHPLSLEVVCAWCGTSSAVRAFDDRMLVADPVYPFVDRPPGEVTS